VARDTPSSSASTSEVSRACPEGDPSSRVEDEHIDRIVLVGVGRELSCALVAALSPWGLEVMSAQASELGSSMPSTSLAAKTVADSHGARVVVWLARDAEGYALWVYDDSGDRAVARPVPDPPFHPSQAAALALSVKTVVRLVGLIAETPPEPVEPGPGPQSQRVDRAPARPPGAPTAPAYWQLGVYAGARLGPFDFERPQGRFGVDLRWVPSGHWSVPSSAWWLSFGLESGESHGVSAPGFEGQASDAAAIGRGGFTVALGSRWSLGLSQAVAGHWVRVSGVATERGQKAAKTRVDPTLVSRAELELSVSQARLVLGVSGSYWTRWHDYVLDGDTVLRMRPASVETSVVLRLPLR
jgi:hypothetical protein